MAQKDLFAAQRIMKDIDHLEEQGKNLLGSSKKMKKLQGYKDLYELRTYYKGMSYRILFKIVKGEAWLLEAFKKKGNGTPQRFIDNAQARVNLIATS